MPHGHGKSAVAHKTAPSHDDAWGAAVLTKLDGLAQQDGKIAHSIDSATKQIQLVAHSVQPPQGLLAEMKAPDYIQLFLLIVAVIAAVVTAFGVRYARRSIDYARASLDEISKARDVENYLKFMDMFDTSWAQFTAAKDPEKNIAFCQLMNRFESTCDLYNRGYLGEATKQMLRSYLREMLPQLWANDVTKKWIDGIHTAPDTFEHIKKFALSENLAGVPN